MGLTQVQLADRSGVGASFLCDIEKGRKQPGLETLMALARELETTTDYLLSHESRLVAASPTGGAQ